MTEVPQGCEKMTDANGRRLQIKVASSPIIAGNFGEVIFSPTFKLYDGLVLDLVALSPTAKKTVKKGVKRKRNDGRTDVVEDGEVMWRVKFIKGVADNCDEMSLKRTKYFLEVDTVKSCTRSSEHCNGIMEFMGKPKSQKSFRGQKLRKGSFIPGVDNLGFRCHCTSSVRKGHHRCEFYAWAQHGKLLSNPFSIRGRPTGSKRPKEDTTKNPFEAVGRVGMESAHNIRIPSPVIPGSVLGGSNGVKRMISPLDYMYNQGGSSTPATPSSCSTVRLSDDSNQRTPSPQYFTSVPPPFRADNISNRTTQGYMEDKSNDSMQSQPEDYKLYRPVATDSRYQYHPGWPSQQHLQQQQQRQPVQQPVQQPMGPHQHHLEHQLHHQQNHQQQQHYPQVQYHSMQHQQQPMSQMQQQQVPMQPQEPPHQAHEKKEQDQHHAFQQQLQRQHQPQQSHHLHHATQQSHHHHQPLQQHQQAPMMQTQQPPYQHQQHHLHQVPPQQQPPPMQPLQPPQMLHNQQQSDQQHQVYYGHQQQQQQKHHQQQRHHRQKQQHDMPSHQPGPEPQAHPEVEVDQEERDFAAEALCALVV